MNAESVPKMVKNDQLDEEFMVLHNLYRAARMAGIRSEYEAIVNVYIALKSRPFLILAGASQTGKIKLVKCLAHVLTETPELQSQLFVGHARWAAQSKDVARFVEMQDEFNRSNLLALIEEASQKENTNRLFIACLTRISPAELHGYFSKPGFLLWPDTEPIPYPPNFRLLGTMDTVPVTGLREDLLTQTTVVHWRGKRLEGELADNWEENWGIPYQKFLHSCISDEQTAYIKLQRLLSGQRKAFLPLMQILDLLHRHDISLPHGVIGEVMRFLANSWSVKGFGLFDTDLLKNLNQALDLAIVQYVLPWIAASKTETSHLLLQIGEMFNGQFNEASAYIDAFQIGYQKRRIFYPVAHSLTTVSP